jgi:hypothetical protein
MRRAPIVRLMWILLKGDLSKGITDMVITDRLLKGGLSMACYGFRVMWPVRGGAFRRGSYGLECGGSDILECGLVILLGLVGPPCEGRGNLVDILSKLVAHTAFPAVVADRSNRDRVIADSILDHRIRKSASPIGLTATGKHTYQISRIVCDRNHAVCDRTNRDWRPRHCGCGDPYRGLEDACVRH